MHILTCRRRGGVEESGFSRPESRDLQVNLQWQAKHSHLRTVRQWLQGFQGTCLNFRSGISSTHIFPSSHPSLSCPPNPSPILSLLLSLRYPKDYKKSSAASFNVTYIAYTYLHTPIIPGWMKSSKQTGGTTAYDGTPFDVVLTSTMLHQLGLYSKIPNVTALRRYRGEAQGLCLWDAQSRI